MVSYAKFSRIARTVFVYAGVLFFASNVLFPYFWMLSTSLKPLTDIFRMPPKLFPSLLTFANYTKVLGDMLFVRYFTNSAFVASTTTLISVFIAVLGAYSLARFRFLGIRIFSRFVLFSYLLPSVLLMVPLFVMLAKIGLVDTLWGLILTDISFTLPFSLWILHSFFLDIPRELEEAAMVDGCSRLGALARVVIPLSAPGIIAVALYTFVLSWNDYLYALILISSESKKTLPLGIASLTTQYDIRWGDAMAASVIASLPVIIFFMFFHKYLIKGLTAGAVKG
jgi:multiple sugar transport system permease protein